MSIEKNLERIADALEKLTTFEFSKVGQVEHASCSGDNTSTTTKGSGGATRKTAAEKKAEKAAKTRAAKEKKKKTTETESSENDGATREDVAVALVEFCDNGPGKAVAKSILEDFKAGSISTLDPDDYEAFIAKLGEVTENES